jgi:hypothetical protein
MAEGSALGLGRAHATICLPFGEEEYEAIVDDPKRFRKRLDAWFGEVPELFPEGFGQGYAMKDARTSRKQEVPLRRIVLRDGRSYSIRPSFLMPYMTARTDDVDGPLFLRKFGVPFWALARVFGGDSMYWYRMEVGLGRSSIVGATARRAELPEDLLADEHHQTRDGKKSYIATTVGGGCVLGAALSEGVGTDDLKETYGVFQEEAADVEPNYAPKTVNTDGWPATQAAWKLLFPLVTILPCFLHAWLKIRDRAKHLGDLFLTISQKVWNAYHAPNRRGFSQRLGGLRTWANGHLSGIALDKVLDLCDKRDLWTLAYDHPNGHRTSNMLDRLMRSMNRYFDDGGHLHGSRLACDRHCRAWALLYNFAPWHPATAKANDGWQSPAERLNRHRYHDNWLHNLLVSASLGGYRNHAPQNP